MFEPTIVAIAIATAAIIGAGIGAKINHYKSIADRFLDTQLAFARGRQARVEEEIAETSYRATQVLVEDITQDCRAAGAAVDRLIENS